MTILTPIFLYLLFYDRLCRDGRVVGAGKPKGSESPHPLIANENILNSKAEYMANVEHSGRIWWRHHDGKWLFLCTIGQIIRIKKPALFPVCIYPRLRCGRVIGLQEFLVHCLLNITKISRFAIWMREKDYRRRRCRPRILCARRGR